MHRQLATLATLATPHSIRTQFTVSSQQSNYAENERYNALVASVVKTNLYMGCAYTAITAAICVMWHVQAPPFHIEFNRLWSPPNANDIPAFMGSSLCGGVDYDVQSLDVFQWLNCTAQQRVVVAAYSDVEARGAPFIPTLEYGPRVSIVWLLISFTLAPAIGHFTLYRWNQQYVVWLKYGIQPVRWCEYSFSAAMMFWVVLSLSRVQERWLLLTLFSLSAYIHFISGSVFELLHLAAKHVPQDLRPLFQCTQWSCFFSGWSAFTVVLSVLYDTFSNVVQPWLDLPAGALWGQLFSIAKWANVWVACSYSMFPVIHLWQIKPFHFGGPRTPVGEQMCYVRCEFAYIATSFISKTLLVVIVFTASFNRPM